MKASTELLSAQFQVDEADLIRKIVEARGETISSFMRRACKKELADLGFIDSVGRQALGIAIEAR